MYAPGFLPTKASLLVAASLPATWTRMPLLVTYMHGCLRARVDYLVFEFSFYRFLGIFWKCTRNRWVEPIDCLCSLILLPVDIGERLSPYVAITCVLMAVHLLTK